MKAQAFPRLLRLRKSSDIDLVLRRGLKASAGHLKCSYMPLHPKQTWPQVAFVTSRRQLRLAVQRNRLRRLMREAFRLERHHLHTPGLALVFRFVGPLPVSLHTLRSLMRIIFEHIDSNCNRES
ncbi:MAG: ribonuclease P protein component [Flavobacteriales bacterium]|nr:ribonuclease P protein component [Flavobacteriales bacterium]MCX7768618.1 ribonuclease P protein component [Flavobacteriales bacterium]MDW8409729.1 ribonuclease P protein component [Flavobacteriales bacterium]